MSKHGPMATRRVRCRWCGWAHPVWLTIRPGELRSGFDALADHCEAEHPLELAVVRSFIDADMAGKERAEDDAPEEEEP